MFCMFKFYSGALVIVLSRNKYLSFSNHVFQYSIYWFLHPHQIWTTHCTLDGHVCHVTHKTCVAWHCVLRRMLHFIHTNFDHYHRTKYTVTQVRELGSGTFGQVQVYVIYVRWRGEEVAYWLCQGAGQGPVLILTGIEWRRTAHGFPMQFCICYTVDRVYWKGHQDLFGKKSCPLKKRAETSSKLNEWVVYNLIWCAESDGTLNLAWKTWVKKVQSRRARTLRAVLWC